MIIDASVLIQKILAKPEAYPLFLLNPYMSYGRFQNLRPKHHIMKIDVQGEIRLGVVPDHYKVDTQASEDVKSELGWTGILEDKVSLTVLGPAIFFQPKYPKELIERVGYTFDVQCIPPTQKHAIMIAYMRSLPDDFDLADEQVMVFGKIE